MLKSKIQPSKSENLIHFIKQFMRRAAFHPASAVEGTSEGLKDLKSARFL